MDRSRRPGSHTNAAGIRRHIQFYGAGNAKCTVERTLDLRARRDRGQEDSASQQRGGFQDGSLHTHA